jgi:hypothetical protein
MRGKDEQQLDVFSLCWAQHNQDHVMFAVMLSRSHKEAVSFGFPCFEHNITETLARRLASLRYCWRRGELLVMI